MNQSNIDLNTLFSQAVSLHNAGNVKEAIFVYKQLLEVSPKQPVIYVYLGNALQSIQCVEEAVASYDQAILLNPDFIDAHRNRGILLNKINRFDEALVSFQKAIELNSNQPMLHFGMGNIFDNLKRFEEALESYDKAITLQPDYLEAYCNRGVILQNLKRFEEALENYDQLIAFKPDCAEAYSNKADVLISLKQFEEALISCDRAILLDPHNVDAYLNRGVALKNIDRVEEALASFDHVITLKFDHAKAHCNRGVALNELKHFGEALASFQQSIILKPDYAEAYCDLSLTLKNLNRFEEALMGCNVAISLKPDFFEAYCNRGIILKNLKRFEEALESYDQAISLKPDYSEFYYNKAWVKLTLGDYESGWKLHEWRLKFITKEQVREFSEPLWLGDTSIFEKTILIYGEQGLGDVIQFCRYASMVKNLGANVILEVYSPLVPLLSTLKSDITIVEKGAPLPSFDFQCPIMSLPLAFKTMVETIPAKIPYLFCDRDKQELWKKRLGVKTKKRIGLVCSGSISYKDDAGRSIPLHFFKPLLELSFEFHLLQKEIRVDDEEFLKENQNVQVHLNDLTDFSDTAALITEMDLVISVDTSVAHLAGALGHPFWILLPWSADWRWLLDRTDSPWYPTATLFRQSEVGNWEGVIADVCERLMFHE